jgi:hypothetical protein
LSLRLGRQGKQCGGASDGKTFHENPFVKKMAIGKLFEVRWRLKII